MSSENTAVLIIQSRLDQICEDKKTQDHDDLKLLLSIVVLANISDELSDDEWTLLQNMSEQHDELFRFVKKYDTENPTELRKKIANCIEKGKSIYEELLTLAMIQKYVEKKKQRGTGR